MRSVSGGVGIEVDVTGSGRPVVLLHGFPDRARLWRKQVPALAAAGFQVIAPDQRGYGRSDKPAAVDDYNLLHLVGDVLGALDMLGIERAHLVGHDWGAAVAWVTAAVAPQRVDHLAVLSVGHPSSFATAGFEQRQLSWYMLLFQFAGVAEKWLSADNWANFREWAHYPEADRVIAELETDQSLTPGLNWYRANIPPSSFVDQPLALPPVAARTMGIWSSGDLALTEKQMTGSSAFVTGSWRYERIEHVGHWMQLEAPEKVNELLLDFLPR